MLEKVCRNPPSKSLNVLAGLAASSIQYFIDFHRLDL